MNIYAQDGKVVIDPHGQLWLTSEEAFNLAADLIDTAKLAKKQQRDAQETGKDSSARQ